MSRSRTRHRKKRRSTSAPNRRTVLESLARFREAGYRCDGCGTEAQFHAPMWAESDPYLITFWASLCESCIMNQERVVKVLEQIRGRGWARPGPPVGEDELPPKTPRQRHLQRG